jgi:hypothetical protein
VTSTAPPQSVNRVVELLTTLPFCSNRYSALSGRPVASTQANALIVTPYSASWACWSWMSGSSSSFAIFTVSTAMSYRVTGTPSSCSGALRSTNPAVGFR